MIVFELCQDILLTRLKARKKRTSLVYANALSIWIIVPERFAFSPKRARPRPHVDTVVRPRLHTSLFQRKFPEPSALSSASDSSEAETEVCSNAQQPSLPRLILLYLYIIGRGLNV